MIGAKLGQRGDRRRNDERPPREVMAPSDAEFEQLYRQNLSLVYRYATTRLGQADGEDVASEVFQAAAVAYRTGAASTVTSAWLMSVTRNKVIDHWRKAGRRKAKDHLLTPARSDLVTLPDDWHHDERRPAVLAALDRCPSRHRAVLILHYVDGMPAPEIADSLEVTVAAIESLLARARRSFRQHYQPPEAS